VRLTTAAARLDRAELVTTALAVGASGALYARVGHPYLARGVVGDLAGLTAMAVPLVTRRRRVRHEALACLGAIGLVHAARATWPLRVPTAALWAAVTVGLGTYLDLRARQLP